MRSRATLPLLSIALIAATLHAGDLIVVEVASPGFSPSMKTSYVSLYTQELEFVSVLRAYPLLSGSPTAALRIGGSLFVGEANCIDLTCAPRVVRFDPDGTTVVFEPVLGSRARSIRLSARGDIVVATQTEIVRFDRASGRALEIYPAAVPKDSFLSDADVDPSGCTVAATIFPNVVARRNICGSEAGWSMLALPVTPPNTLKGIRFLPDGTMLAGAKTIFHLDRDGAILETFPVGEDGGCLVETDRSGREATLGCAWYLIRLDLATGEILRRAPIHNGISTGSISAIEPEPPPRGRRRSVRR